MPDRGRRAWSWLKPRLPWMATAVVAGLLLYAAFAPLGWWAAVPAFAVFAVVLIRPQTTGAGGFGYGLLFGLAFYLPLLPWISGLVGALPWIALSVVCALFPALFGLLATTVRGLPGWPVWFAVLWVAVEWLKCSMPFGGFPWGVVGFSQSNGPLLALARIGGAPVVSLAVVLLGCAFTALVLELVGRLRHDEAVRPGVAHVAEPPAVITAGVIVAVVLVCVALVHPQVRRSATGAGGEPSVTVAVVQGNVPRLGLEFNAQRRAVLDNHVTETLRLAEEVRAGRAPQPQFVVWPENSADIDPLANVDAADQITRAALAIDAPILVGGVVATADATRDNPTSTNSVIVWDPQAGPQERHDKKIVQPFGEYLPWRGFFRLLSPYADRAGYFVPGTGNGVVHAAGVPIGVTTCWEVIFDRAARAAVHGGAQVLTVPTNNATFNETMSEQQLAFARLRAVEHDRYVVVAGTTGISAVIAPDGAVVARTQFFTPAFLDVPVRLKSAVTVAARYAEVFQYVLVGVGLLAVALGIMQNGGFMRPTRRRRHQPMIDSTGGPDDPQGAP
jgi:apolipoprotein N-acyltransferase